MSPSQVGRTCARDLAKMPSRTEGWVSDEESDEESDSWSGLKSTIAALHRMREGRSNMTRHSDIALKAGL